MRLRVRLGLFALAAAAPALASSCRGGERDEHAPLAVEPAALTASSDAGVCGGHGAVDVHEDELAVAEGLAPSLERFASPDDLAALVQTMRTSPPHDPGGVWGSAIGDAFGGAGLGLSGIGEAQQFGMIGLLSAGPSPWASTTGDAITNNQHASVDEGGIVKVHGDHFVVLRRGRLFTVRTADLAPVASIDAFAPGTDPTGAWYDELLVSGDTVVIIGYSYARGGTELGLFDIDARGALRARATYHLRSNDYYSSRNYASRLVGDKLVFYTPLYVPMHADVTSWMPAMRRWSAGASSATFAPIASATSIYRPLYVPRAGEGLALHTVTTCDLSDRSEMRCRARGVLAGASRSFYVSPGAVYVWTTRWQPQAPGSGPAIVYRLPLDEHDEPGVLRSVGAPVDQLSFVEEGGHLDVLVRPNGPGDAMWGPEIATASLALFRVPISAFSTRTRFAPPSAYTKLPSAGTGPLQNRFMGKHLVYATGTGWASTEAPSDDHVYVTRFTEPAAPTFGIRVGHAVDRIEALGDDALAVGPDDDALHFTAVDLSSKNARPRVASRYSRAGAVQGEVRTHGFFYRRDGDGDGVLGLPIRTSSRFDARYHAGAGSAKVLLLKNDGLALREAGTLSASEASTPGNDGCVASCVDWYGNARPIFMQGRVIALLGYELVEGRIVGARVQETRRASFAPRR